MKVVNDGRNGGARTGDMLGDCCAARVEGRSAQTQLSILADFRTLGHAARASAGLVSLRWLI